MDGILSGFRFSSKKTPSEHRQDTQQQPAPALPQKTPAAPPPVATDSTNHDRSQTMRLNKTNPGKPDEEFEIPADPVIASAFNNPTPASPRPVTGGFASASSPSAVIGPKITFKGELTGEEDLMIQGRVEGTIDLKGNHLTIGKQGVVKANLMAKTITIEGTVEGDLIGQDRIEIKSSSNVKGNLIAARVTLEDGAKFRGSIDMESHNASGSKYAVNSSENSD
jgi:cytoskeletal protein CcmA (bactofilin family)